MNDLYEDCYVVYARSESVALLEPEAIETPVATCSSYEEAAQVRHDTHLPGRRCIIRAVGPTGGGD